jgi:hypothetical protein
VNFSFVQNIRATVTSVEAALFDTAFVKATSDLPRVDDCALIGRHDDGTTIRAQIHRRFDAPLNAAVRRVIDPSRLTWVEHVDYDTATHAGRHTIDPDHYRDRLRCTFRTALVAEGDHTRRTVDGSLTVKAAFVARKVEAAIVDGLREYSAAEAELLSTWGG